MRAPIGFTQHLSREIYETAQKIAAKKRGVLRFTPAVIMGAAALAVLGGWTILRNPYALGFWMTGMLFAACAAVLLVLWLFVFPAREARKAEVGYAFYDALYGETAITFSSDEMTLAGERLSRRVEFAKTRLCMETADCFLIFTDDAVVVMLEKAAFGNKRETTDFLRDVFARWYVRKGRVM